MEFLRETRAALALRQGPGVSATAAADYASMPRRGSVSLANSHVDGLSIGCIRAGYGAAETDDTPKGFRLELQEQRKSLKHYKRPTTFKHLRRALPAPTSAHR
jgi:hypothetical protein